MVNKEWLCLSIIIISFNLINATGLYKPTDNVTIFDANNIISTIAKRYVKQFFWINMCYN